MHRKAVHATRLFAVVFVVVLLAVVFLGLAYFGRLSNNSPEVSPINTLNPHQVANLVTSLGCNEIGFDYQYRMPLPYNYLYIAGSVNNTGLGIAYNAGLKVAAFASNGTQLVDMTVPLRNITFGATSEISLYLEKNLNFNQSLTLGQLPNGQNETIALGIAHEGTASNWTLTPVWTNIP
jgi:hypothetical protein